MMEPVGVCSPIIALPVGFHGESGGTREAYGPCMGKESLSGSPSSSTMCRRSVCGRRGQRAGDVGRALVGCVVPGGGDSGRFAFIFVRVGACADELRLMGVKWRGLPTDAGEAGGDEGSLARKLSRACVPPAMERMCRGLWGDGASWTMQFVESGGRLKDRRCSLVGRLVATNGRRS